MLGQRLAEVEAVSEFVCGHGVPCMTYIMPRFPDDDNEAMCSHSNANSMKSSGFGSAKEWLEGRGFTGA